MKLKIQRLEELCIHLLAILRFFTLFFLDSKTPTHPGSSDICNLDSLSCSKLYTANKLENDTWGTNNSDNEMCQIDDNDDFMLDEVKLRSSMTSANFKVRKMFGSIFSSPSRDLWKLTLLFLSFFGWGGGGLYRVITQFVSRRMMRTANLIKVQ